MGLLFSDGNLNKSKNKITLSLSDEDLIKQIYPIFSDIEKRKIYSYDDNDPNHAVAYSIINSNKESIKKLIDFGMYENKSLSISFPEIKEEKNKISFLRGYFDGDGSIYYQTTHGKNQDYIYKNISFTTGSECFAVGLIKCLESIKIYPTMFIDKREIKKNYTYYVYIRKKNDVKRFFDLIYSNNNSIYSKIKYTKFLKI